MKGTKKRVTTKKSSTFTRGNRQAPKIGGRKAHASGPKKTSASTSRKGAKRVQKAKGSPNKRASRLTEKEILRLLDKELAKNIKEIETDEKISEQFFKREFAKISKSYNQNIGRIQKYSKKLTSTLNYNGYTITNYRVLLKEEDKINLGNVNERDFDEIRYILQPYFEKIFNRIRKHPALFVTKILYIDNGFNAISHPKRDVEMMPDEFYLEIDKLIELLLLKVEKYQTSRSTNLVIYGIEFQTYKKPKGKTRVKRNKRTKTKRR